MHFFFSKKEKDAKKKEYRTFLNVQKKCTKEPQAEPA